MRSSHIFFEDLQKSNKTDNHQRLFEIIIEYSFAQARSIFNMPIPGKNQPRIGEKYMEDQKKALYDLFRPRLKGE